MRPYPGPPSQFLASAQGNLGIAPAAKRMRRLFGPMGKTVRQNDLEVTDMGDKAKTASDDDDFAAWAAYRKENKI